MQIKSAILTILCMLVSAGCASNPTAVPKVVAAGACAAAELGIIADKNFQVSGVVANGSAAEAGVQVGDVLVDMTLVSVGERFVCNDVVMIGPGESPLAINAPVAVPAEAPTEHNYPTKPVPFTDREGIRTLTDYGVTLTLRMIRGDKTVELTIKPGGRGLPTNRPGGDPTATPTVIPAGTGINYY